MRFADFSGAGDEQCFTSRPAGSRDAAMDVKAAHAARQPLDLDDDALAWRLALGVAAALLVLRIAAIFATPLELYPDEPQCSWRDHSQYWASSG